MCGHFWVLERVSMVRSDLLFEVNLFWGFLVYMNFKMLLLRGRWCRYMADLLATVVWSVQTAQTKDEGHRSTDKWRMVPSGSTLSLCSNTPVPQVAALLSLSFSASIFTSNVLPHTAVRSSVWLEGAIWLVPSERLSFPTFLSLSWGLNWTVSSAIAGLCHLAMHRNCLFLK